VFEAQLLYFDAASNITESQFTVLNSVIQTSVLQLSGVPSMVSLAGSFLRSQLTITNSTFSANFGPHRESFGILLRSSQFVDSFIAITGSNLSTAAYSKAYGIFLNQSLITNGSIGVQRGSISTTSVTSAFAFAASETTLTQSNVTFDGTIIRSDGVQMACGFSLARAALVHSALTIASAQVVIVATGSNSTGYIVHATAVSFTDFSLLTLSNVSARCDAFIACRGLNMLAGNIIAARSMIQVMNSTFEMQSKSLNGDLTMLFLAQTQIFTASTIVFQDSICTLESMDGLALGFAVGIPGGTEFSDDSQLVISRIVVKFNTSGQAAALFYFATLVMSTSTVSISDVNFTLLSAPSRGVFFSMSSSIDLSNSLITVRRAWLDLVAATPQMLVLSGVTAVNTTLSFAQITMFANATWSTNASFGVASMDTSRIAENSTLEFSGVTATVVSSRPAVFLFLASTTVQTGSRFAIRNASVAMAVPVYSGTFLFVSTSNLHSGSAVEVTDTKITVEANATGCLGIQLFDVNATFVTISFNRVKTTLRCAYAYGLVLTNSDFQNVVMLSSEFVADVMAHVGGASAVYTPSLTLTASSLSFEKITFQVVSAQSSAQAFLLYSIRLTASSISVRDSLVNTSGHTYGCGIFVTASVSIDSQVAVLSSNLTSAGRISAGADAVNLGRLNSTRTVFLLDSVEMTSDAPGYARSLVIQGCNADALQLRWNRVTFVANSVGPTTGFLIAASSLTNTALSFTNSAGRISGTSATGLRIDIFDSTIRNVSLELLHFELDVIGTTAAAGIDLNAYSELLNVSLVSSCLNATASSAFPTTRSDALVIGSRVSRAAIVLLDVTLTTVSSRGGANVFRTEAQMLTITAARCSMSASSRLGSAAIVTVSGSAFDTISLRDSVVTISGNSATVVTISGSTNTSQFELNNVSASIVGAQSTTVFNAVSVVFDSSVTIERSTFTMSALTNADFIYVASDFVMSTISVSQSHASLTASVVTAIFRTAVSTRLPESVFIDSSSFVANASLSGNGVSLRGTGDSTIAVSSSTVRISSGSVATLLFISLEANDRLSLVLKNIDSVVFGNSSTTTAVTFAAPMQGWLEMDNVTVRYDSHTATADNWFTSTVTLLPDFKIHYSRFIRFGQGSGGVTKPATLCELICVTVGDTFLRHIPPYCFGDSLVDSAPTTCGYLLTTTRSRTDSQTAPMTISTPRFVSSSRSLSVSTPPSRTWTMERMATGTASRRSSLTVSVSMSDATYSHTVVPISSATASHDATETQQQSTSASLSLPLPLPRTQRWKPWCYQCRYSKPWTRRPSHPPPRPRFCLLVPPCSCPA
jgi:hypothetical protein